MDNYASCSLCATKRLLSKELLVVGRYIGKITATIVTYGLGLTKRRVCGAGRPTTSINPGSDALAIGSTGGVHIELDISPLHRQCRFGQGQYMHQRQPGASLNRAETVA